MELGRVGRDSIDRVGIVVDGLERSQDVERLWVVRPDALIDEPEFAIERDILGGFSVLLLDSLQ